MPDDLFGVDGLAVDDVQHASAVKLGSRKGSTASHGRELFRVDRVWRFKLENRVAVIIFEAETLPRSYAHKLTQALHCDLARFYQVGIHDRKSSFDSDDTKRALFKSP